MNKEYVQQYVHLENEHWWFLVRQKFILKFLKKYLPFKADQKLQVLNIGVAGGATTRMLAEFGNVVSVETEPWFVEYLRSNNIDVRQASITELPFDDNSFDLVCAFDVIEHVEDDILSIKEMTRVCKTDGAICLTVPAFKMLWSEHDIVNGHCRRYTGKSLQEILFSFSTLNKIKTLYFNSLLFLPILITRKISNLVSKRKDTKQSDFTYFKTSAISNRLLKFVFGLELPLMGLIHFPFGVSLIALQQKKDSQAKAVKK